MTTEWTSKISIVMITHDRCDQVLETLAAIKSESSDIGCIVVDNGSTDMTVEKIIADFPDIVLIRNDKNAGSIGYNQGVLASGTPYIALCNDDTWWGRWSLDEAVKYMDNYPMLAVIMGKIIIEPEGGIDPVCFEMDPSPLPNARKYPGQPLINFLSGASIVRKEAFLAAGGFKSTRFFSGEEELLSCDMLEEGWHLTYIPELIVHYRPFADNVHSIRKAKVARNILWFTWIRRPLLSSLHKTFQLLSKFSWSSFSISGFFDSVKSVPWVIRNRRCIKPGTEALYKIIERQHLRY